MPEVVDFRPAGEGAGNRTADCAAMQSRTLAKVQGLKLQLAKLSCRRNQNHVRFEMAYEVIDSKPTPPPGGRQKSSH